MISIHSLRMEGDDTGRIPESPAADFNPLPPHGGRHGRNCRMQYQIAISIHSLRMEGDNQNDQGRQQRCISIHSLRMEGDQDSTPLPTLSGISIHSLRMEGDGAEQTVPVQGIHFNPLPPHGGRHGSWQFCRRTSSFQSTPSAWRETHSHACHA